jgi:hypothetical protein
MDSFDYLLEGFQLISFDWKYLYVNSAVIKQSKYEKKEDLLGFTMMEKYPGIEKTEMFKSLQYCMNSRKSIVLENEFIYPDKSKGWFDLRIEAVPEGIFILSIDITSRKLAEQETVKHIQGLEEMLFMTSHKVRQPIANILGISNLLSSESLNHDELKKILEYTKDSILSLDKFTKDLTCFMQKLQKS